MALIKTSSEIQSIRGRFGGVYFKTGQDGKHIQAMPRVWDYARSTAQLGGFSEESSFTSAGIHGYSGLAAFWGLALLGFFASAWAAYSLAHLFFGPNSQGKRITGYNWYLHYGLAFPECERPPFWKPPHSPGVLPNFIATFRGEWIYHEAPKDWPVDCCAGYYWPGVPWNDKPSYKRDDLEWFLWWKDPNWVLSPGPGFEPAGKTFYSDASQINDYYYNPVTGHRSNVYWGRPGEKDLPH